ncbi:MAG TPA: hypothetical protein VEY30_11420 [Myxococcaceae bacterium]|nr:hypothetical protein [Myxococcaceae bacterium]
MRPKGACPPARDLRAGLALIGLWLSAGAAVAADGGPTGADGAGTPTVAQDRFRPQPLAKDSYGESFTFLADLDDGTYVWTQFSVTNIGPGSNHGICRASVVSPDGRLWKADKRVQPGDDEDGWRYDGGSHVLWIGRCSITEGSAPEIRAVFKEGSVTLRFAEPLRPIKVDGSEFRIGGYVYRVNVLQPHARVKATLTLGKAAPRTVDGSGYADHAYTAAEPSKVARHWVRFRALRTTPTVLLGRQGFDGSVGPAFRWTGQGVSYFREFTLERTGKDSSTNWSVRLGEPDKGTLKTFRFLNRRSFIQDLGFLGKMVKPFVGSPVTYTHRAVYERPGQPPVEGILEVSLEEG